MNALGRLVTFDDADGDTWTLPITALGLRKHLTVGVPTYHCFDLADTSYEFAEVSEDTYTMLQRAMIIERDMIPYTKFVS
jgi:hypothetical protein